MIYPSDALKSGLYRQYRACRSMLAPRLAAALRALPIERPVRRSSAVPVSGRLRRDERAAPWPHEPFDRLIDTGLPFCDGPALAPVTSRDIELMKRAALGDPEAFAAIYDRHAGALLALARRILPGSEDALDLLHDVFLEAWQHVRDYDATRSVPKTWLIIRLRSRALDRKARAARGASIARQLQAVPALNEASAGQAAPHDERQLEVARALSDLDHDVRRVLELTYFDGLTAPEISAREGTAIGTVRSRLARGLDQLRRLLRTLDETRS